MSRRARRAVAVREASSGEAARRLLERAERFVVERGNHRAWRIDDVAARLASTLQGTPLHGRALALLIDVLRGGDRLIELEPRVAEAAALGLERTDFAARCSMLSARVALALDARTPEVAMQWLDELESLPGLPRGVALEAAGMRHAALVGAGRLQEAAAGALQLLRRLTGDPGRPAAFQRGLLHLSLSRCARGGVAGPGAGELHAGVALALVRHSGGVPLQAMVALDVMDSLEARGAGLAALREAVDPSLRVLHAFDIRTVGVAVLYAGYAHRLLAHDMAGPAAAAAREAWRRFEQLGFPAASRPSLALMEEVFSHVRDEGLRSAVQALRLAVAGGDSPLPLPLPSRSNLLAAVPPLSLVVPAARSRPERPSRLFGRAVEEALLLDVLGQMREFRRAAPGRVAGGASAADLLIDMEAAATPTRVLAVHGAGGAGKSSLVRSLAPALALRDGILAAGPEGGCEERGPFDVLAHALGGLADHWSSGPPDKRAQIRLALRRCLGGAAASLVRIAPDFESLLERTDVEATLDTNLEATLDTHVDASLDTHVDANLDTHVDANLDTHVDAMEDLAEGDESSSPRQLSRQALAGLFQVVRQQAVPLVLFVDDLQCADAASLALIESIATDHSHGAVLLALAWRDDEVDAGHPLRESLMRIRGSGARVVDIALEGLAPAANQALLADVLGTDPRKIQALAFALHRRTAGHPGAMLQAVRRLFEAGDLKLHDRRWDWSQLALQSLPSAQGLLELSLKAFAELSAATIALAGGCACLGETVDVDLLARAQGIDLPRLDAQLQPLLRHGVLGVVPTRGPGGRVLRFGHRRLREAAHASLAPHEVARWHLAFARALSVGGADQRGAGRSIVRRRRAAADHYLEALSPWLSSASSADGGPLGGEGRAEHPEVARCLFASAGEAFREAAFERALRLTEGIDLLAPSLPGEADLVLRSRTMRHAVLCRLRRYAQADRAFAALASDGDPDAVSLAPAITQQMGALSRRGMDEAAVALGLAHLRLLGIEVPVAEGWHAAWEDEAIRLRDALNQHGVGTFDRLGPIAVPALEQAGRMLVAAQLAATATRVDVAAWSRLRAVRLGLEHGRFATLPLAMLECVPLAGPDDFALGHQVAQAGLRLFGRHPSAVLAPAIHHRMALLVGHWFEPLERCSGYARHALDLSIETGQPELAAATQVTLGAVAMECALDLDEALHSLRTGPRGTRHRGPLGCRLAYRQFALCLKGQTRSPGEFDDIEVGASEQVTQAYMASWQALAAAYFGDWPRALRHARTAAPMLVGVAGHYVAYQQRWVHAMALCHTLRRDPGSLALAAELTPLLAWLECRGGEAPVNFGHTFDLVRALHAWAVGDISGALAAFEAGIDSALEHQRPGHHALACELAAEFHASLGAARAADAYREAAIDAYGAWGATAKVAALRGVPHSSGVARPPAVRHRRVASPDLEIVAQASQVLSRERDPNSLVRLLFEQMRRHAQAERGTLFWESEGRWLACAGFHPGGTWHEGDPPADPDSSAQRRVPPTVFSYLTQSLKPLLLIDVDQHPRFGHDRVVQECGIKSIVGLPIQHRGRAMGMLYLETRQNNTTVQPLQLETLGLIGLQFSMAYENAHVNRHLEALVEQRTGELRQENQDRRRAEEAAASASRAKSEFLANMSHEIRTPMNAILGMSHLALRSGLNAQQQNYVQKVERSAESLLGLINDILDFSKIEAGKLDMETVPFQLGDVMDNLANLVGLKAEEKGLELLFVEPPDLPMALVGDPLRLGQVLVNLGNNAVKFTDRGEVIVSVEALDRGPAQVTLRFSVRDSGIGIAPEDQARLFQPFSQAGSGTTRRFGGTGLGLSISHHLVGLMGGEIGLESTPGQGSNFWFDARFGLQPPGRSGAPRHGSALGAARVLVVDDNASARKILAEMSSSLGLAAEETRDGWDALRAVTLAVDAGSPFDLVLLDWKMPAMDGVEFVRQLNQQLRHRAPPVVMMTAFGREEVLERLANQQLAVCDVLTKPVTPSTFFDACAAALGQAARSDSRSARQQEALRDHRAQLRGARVLLAEDNAINQELVTELLGDAGIVVTVVDDGRKAIDALGRQAFDGVLMDCQMPLLDGYDATREIRAQSRWASLPVIAMTANTMAGDREKALAAGMNDHIAKPFDVQAMFDTIARWIRPVDSARAPAPTPAASANGGLDGLAGIDTTIGRATTGGSDKLYRRLLVMFRDGHHGFGSQFLAARRRDDPEGALRLAHNLRSAAESLGATEVTSTALSLEQACLAGADDRAVRTALAVLQDALGPVLETLHDLH